MPVAHLHKNLAPREYCPALFDVLKNWPRTSAVAEYVCGVLQAMDDRRQLIKDFTRRHCKDLHHDYGWHDLDPHVGDVGVEGHPVATIETHHNSGDVTVYKEHQIAGAFIEEALSHGYKKV
ncbi:MAG: hypothetical protein WC613_00305 [Candidatus Aenigmatarchaeota archaeon]